jgi:hypothetical protein
MEEDNNLRGSQMGTKNYSKMVSRGRLKYTFFHRQAIQRKMKNTIWKITNQEGKFENVSRIS